MQFNVVHGAQGGTFAAADAAVVHRKRPVMDAGGVKNRVDDIGHKLAKHRGFRLRYRTAVSYGSSGLLQRRHRSGKNVVHFFRRVWGGKQGNVIFRHNDLCCAHIVQPQSGAELPVCLRGVVYFTATGHHKVCLPAAGKMALGQKIRKNMGNLPGIGGANKYPWSYGMEPGRGAALHKGGAVPNRVVQPVPQQFRRIAAVAGAGVVQDHKKLL